MEQKVIFIVQGFTTMNPEGHMSDVVTIEVYAKTEQEAVEKARKYVAKKFYRVNQVIEK